MNSQTFPKEFYQACRHYENAVHLLTTTYPSLQDPKIFLSIVDNLYQAVNLSTIALQVKSIQELAEKYPLRKETKEILIELKEIVDSHKKSPVEFRRGTKMVICKTNYRLIVLTTSLLETYLQRIKEFLEYTDTILKGK